MIKVIKNKKGVTLLELTVAVAIFSVVMLLVMQIFKMVIEGQRNAIAAQNMQESMRYALEVISKDIRMAKKDDRCELITDGKVYKIEQGGGMLVYKNKNDICTRIYLNGIRIEIFKGGTLKFITPDEIKVSNLEFVAVDTDGKQPMVTMKMDIEAVGKEMHKQSMKIQTTISSRNYE